MTVLNSDTKLTRANSVFVAGYDGASYENKRALLWKNGVRTVLSSNDAQANCVFVKQ